MLRIHIQQIRRDGRGSGECREAIHGPAKRDPYPAQLVLDGLTKEDETAKTNDPGWVDAPKTILWSILAVVRTYVTIAKEVVEPVAPELGQDGPDHWREVKQGYGRVREEVGWRLHELGDGGNDSDGPHSDPGNEAEGWQIGVSNVARVLVHPSDTHLVVEAGADEGDRTDLLSPPKHSGGPRIHGYP